jgi:hypothetical protein
MGDKSVFDSTAGAKKKDNKSPKNMGKNTNREQATRSDGMPVAVYIVSACLVMALLFLLVEIIVLLGMAAPKLFTMNDEVNVMLRNLNQGSSNIDFNFGITVNPPPAAGESSSGVSAASTESVSGSVSLQLNEETGEVWLDWCASSACLQGHNCTEIVLGLAEGVDPTNGAPIIPLPPNFCQSALVLNDNLCLCDSVLKEGQFPSQGQAMLDNMSFVAMLCGFQQANYENQGQCA